MIETDATAYISQSGHVYANGAITRDSWYLTQHWVLQPLVELDAMLNSDRRAQSGAGLNDLDLSLRLRYQIRRELAPYIGVSSRWTFGETASMARARGEDTSRVQFIAGMRIWY